MQIVKSTTPHPAAGMTPAQRRDFERICIGQRPLGGFRVLKALKERGLIEDAPPKVIGRDALGEIAVPQWSVPLRFHAQWCQWCSESRRGRTGG